MFIVKLNGHEVICDTAAQVRELTSPSPISSIKLIPREELHTPRQHARNAVLNAIARHPEFRTARLVKYAGVSYNVFQYHVQELKVHGKIRQGKKGRGYYEVVK